LTYVQISSSRRCTTEGFLFLFKGLSIGILIYFFFSTLGALFNDVLNSYSLNPVDAYRIQNERHDRCTKYKLLMEDN